MGTLFSVIVYAVYLLLALISLWSFSKGKYVVFIASYFSLLHINVTSFSNLGIAWTGDFVVMMYVICNYGIRKLLLGIRTRTATLYIGSDSRIVFAFWLLIASSVLCSFVREIHLVGDYGMSPFTRSMKSFVKLSIYMYAATLIARSISAKIKYSELVNALSLSGFLPCIAVLYQTYATSSPMSLFHNNNTFTQVPKLILYDGARGVGLSDESSFFALCVSFSFVGSLSGLVSFSGRMRYLHAAMIALQFFAISLSLSRTGMLGIACATLVFFGQKSIRTTLKACIVSGALVFVINYLSVISGVQFSLIDRFMSVFDVQYSASNLERYGIAASLWSLLWTKGSILGYGFFNYMYYVSEHFPDFMRGMHYETVEAIPSFNLIVQLLAEVGLIQTFAFIGFCVYSSMKRRIIPETDEQARQLILTIGAVVLISAMSVNVFAFGMPFIFVIFMNVQFKRTM